MSRLSWVRGNSVLMTVTLKQKNTDGTETPIDLSTYDAWACKVWRLSAYKKVETEVVVALDQSGHVVLSISGSIPCGTYSVEVVCDKELTGGGLANRRSYETPVFAVVESNGEAHTTYDVVQCQLSADIEMTFQLTPMATQLGKNAYEMWKELPGHADKTLQEYIDEVLDLNTITAECEAAIVIATHPDYIGEDNYVYHWTNGAYVKTDIYCKGDPGTGGEVDWDDITDKPTFATVATSGSYNDLSNKPTIPTEVTESTVAGWGFTKNTGTYSKPSGGIPKTDLASGVQTSLGKADTALQSFTETDPTVPSWAKAESKPTYTLDEVSDGSARKLSDYQPKLTTQTAYTSKGSATKVPKITTNTLGQVTGITEVTITQPDVSNCIQKSDTSGLVKNDGTIDTSTYLTSAHEVPAGGNAGQVLAKNSATNYDLKWVNQTQYYPSAYCTTAAGTAAKVASCSLWVATANSYLHVLIGQANTSASALTLNVNSTGAKPVYINGSASSSSNYTLPAGSYIIFYDGTNYYFRTDGKIQGLQPTLTTQTAYTSKGTATKVPQITTNTLGQVTSITEVTITQPDITGKEDKMDIITVSATSLAPSVNKYYRFTADVGTLAVTLPTVTDTTKVASIVFYLTTGSSPNVTFTSSHSVVYQDGFQLDASKTYEVNALFNGAAWVLMAAEINTGS